MKIDRNQKADSKISKSKELFSRETKQQKLNPHMKIQINQITYIYIGDMRSSSVKQCDWQYDGTRIPFMSSKTNVKVPLIDNMDIIHHGQVQD